MNMKACLGIRIAVRGTASKGQKYTSQQNTHIHCLMCLSVSCVHLWHFIAENIHSVTSSVFFYWIRVTYWVDCIVDQWTADMNDINSYPILRTYRHIKISFRTEPYICLVKDKRYRHAISRFRCSSHMLHIEKGRYTRPKPHWMKDCVIHVTVLKTSCIL